MILVDERSFEKACGKMMPVRRNMSTFNGDKFKCACGAEHTFDADMISVLTEGLNGRFVVVCPHDSSLLSLIKTKMKWGILYQGLEYLSGHKVED
ncbi:hypothetical protein RP300_00244 [Oligella urethralis]|uniref:hypothetical protein n=1 Tax=Oligella urethralis TaxID=90245 RepID=UPI002958C379|nr:hypothetical protein [Oligella urethralis]WOS36714.1 hypothetical protein RP300_00244 [Oligella urethralis]